MPTDQSAKELRELSDREAIRDCLMRYCHGVDRCDEPMIRDVYWPEATDEHGMFNGPASEYVGVLMPMLRGMEATSHRLSNIWIVLEGDRAKVETYMTAYHRTRGPGGALRDAVINGRYLDLMEKRGSEWRILRRAVVVDWFRQFPDSADWEKTRVLKTMKPGARKPEDRYYDFFAPSRSSADGLPGFKG